MGMELLLNYSFTFNRRVLKCNTLFRYLTMATRLSEEIANTKNNVDKIKSLKY